MNSQHPAAPAGDLGRRSFLLTTAALGAAAMAPSGALARSAPGFASVDEWIAREAIPFSSDKDFNAAVDRMMARLGDQVSVLGFGEALHGGEEFLTVRNRLFQRLVEAHGYRAITIETNDMRARLVDAYVQGKGAASYEAIADSGFTLGIGRWDANRDLVEWIRRYNADPAHKVKLNLYGTLASDQETTKSPRQALELALAYLGSIDPAAAARHKKIMEPLLGADADWEEAATAIANEINARLQAGETTAHPGPGQEIGVSPRAQALRLAVDDFGAELQTRRPELVSKSDGDSFGRALRDVTVAHNLLAMHAALARRESLDTLVSMRDAMAAEHIAYVTEREKPRGKVLVFLHTGHLRRTKVKFPWYEFWPTGAHLDVLLGERFAVIAGAVGASEENLIEPAEPGSIEGRLSARKSDCFLPTHRGKGIYQGAPPPARSRATKIYIPYEPLTQQSVADADVICFLRTVTHVHGMPPYPR